MAEFDTSMYGSVGKAAVPVADPMQKAGEMYKMADLAMNTKVKGQEFKDNQDIRSALSQATDENGTTDWSGAIAKLAKTNPLAGMKVASQKYTMDAQRAELQQKQLETQVNQAGFLSNLMGGATDQTGWMKARQTIASMGKDVSHISEQYNPQEAAYYRGLAKNMYVDAKDRLSAHNQDIEERFKGTELGIRQKEVNLKLAEFGQKQVDELKNDLDPNKGRAGNMGTTQATVNSADRVNGIFQQFPDYNIPKAQTHELANAVAGLINGGSAQSQAAINNVTPETLRGHYEDVASWVTDNPNGQQQQKFMKMLHESANREGEIAYIQTKNAQVARLFAHQGLAEAHPDAYKAGLEHYDIDPKKIKNGKYVADKDEWQQHVAKMATTGGYGQGDQQEGDEEGGGPNVINSANAGGGKGKFSTEDLSMYKLAVDRAAKNPKDKVAQQALAHFKMMGLGKK